MGRAPDERLDHHRQCDEGDGDQAQGCKPVVPDENREEDREREGGGEGTMSTEESTADVLAEREARKQNGDRPEPVVAPTRAVEPATDIAVEDVEQPHGEPDSRQQRDPDALDPIEQRPPTIAVRERDERTDRTGQADQREAEKEHGEHGSAAGFDAAERPAQQAGFVVAAPPGRDEAGIGAPGQEHRDGGQCHAPEPDQQAEALPGFDRGISLVDRGQDFLCLGDHIGVGGIVTGGDPGGHIVVGGHPERLTVLLGGQSGLGVASQGPGFADATEQTEIVGRLALADAVEYQGDEEVGQTTRGCLCQVVRGDGLQEQLAEASRAHDRCDAEHRDRHQQCLVEAGEDRRSCQRKLHVGQHPELVRAEGATGLDDVGGHLSDPEVGEPHQWGQGEHERRHRRGRLPGSPEEDEGQHVDEWMNDLHRVEDRTYRVPCAVDSSAQDPEWDADHRTQQDRHEDHAEGLGGLGPVVGPEEATGRDQGCGHDPDPGRTHDRTDQEEDDRDPVPGQRHDRGGAFVLVHDQLEEELERPDERVEQPTEVDVGPVDDLLDPLAEVELVLVEPGVVPEARRAGLDLVGRAGLRAVTLQTETHAVTPASSGEVGSTSVATSSPAGGPSPR